MLVHVNYLLLFYAYVFVAFVLLCTSPHRDACHVIRWTVFMAHWSSTCTMPMRTMARSSTTGCRSCLSAWSGLQNWRGNWHSSNKTSPPSATTWTNQQSYALANPLHQWAGCRPAGGHGSKAGCRWWRTFPTPHSEHRFLAPSSKLCQI